MNFSRMKGMMLAMFFISNTYITAPDQFSTPLQEKTYQALQELHIIFERVDTDEAITMDISRVSFAPAELTEQMFGTKIGAATVFSALLDTENVIQIVFDKDVLAEECYGCSAGTVFVGRC